jgi:hypothetical protein
MPATWQEIELSLDVLRGLARPDLHDPASSNPNPLHVDPQMQYQAKKRLSREFINKIGSFVIQRGGRVIFLNEVAVLSDETELLHEEVQEALAFAYLHIYYHSKRIMPDDRASDDAEYYWGEFRRALEALCIVTPDAIMSDSDPDIIVQNSMTMSVTSNGTYDGY